MSDGQIHGMSFRITQGQRSQVGTDWQQADVPVGDVVRHGRIRWYGDAVCRYVVETGDGRLVQFSLSKQSPDVQAMLTPVFKKLKVSRRGMSAGGSAACCIQWVP